MLAACKDPPPRPLARDAAVPPVLAATPPIAGWPELAGLALREPAWLVDLGPLAPRPEIAAHPPLVIAERVVIAGSRTGYVGLARATGEVAWRRPGGTFLAAPLVLGRDDVVLVGECDGAVGAPAGHAVLACLDRIDPVALAARTAERIFVREDSVGDCLAGAGAGPWTLAGDDPAALTLGRGACRFTLALPGGRATRLADAPPAAPADAWAQTIVGTASRVVRPPISLPGLLVLAEARGDGRGAVVVRADASLERDYLAAYDRGRVVWVWPLPAPPDGGRGGPVAVSAGAGDVVVFFDGGRVARFTTR